jgi:hypothetical protein
MRDVARAATGHLTRRAFIRTVTISTAALAAAATIGAPSRLFGQTRPAGGAGGGERPLYCFPLLGDIHYDRMAHHDMDWVRREKPGDERQINGYVATTEKYTPRLLAEVAAAVKSAAAPVPFVIQIGDLVEGLCGSFDLQSLQFRDAFGAIDEAALGVPLLITKGNHDITGPGAPESFDQVLLPWLSKQAKQDLSRANYTTRHGDDLFVFFDAYKPDLDWLDGALKDHGARRVFFVIHPPVVPYNARANWHVFANENQESQRARLLELLGTHRAIVLSGHLHKYGLLTRQTDAGPFVQLAVSSVIRNDVEAPRDERGGVEQYTPDLLDLEPRFSPDTADRRRRLLAAEALHIRQFEYADVPGYAMVNVFADRVDVDLYTGVGQRHWKSRPLKPDVAPQQQQQQQQPAA